MTKSIYVVRAFDKQSNLLILYAKFNEFRMDEYEKCCQALDCNKSAYYEVEVERKNEETTAWHIFEFLAIHGVKRTVQKDSKQRKEKIDK